MEQNTQQNAYYDKEGDLIDLSVIYGVYKTRDGLYGFFRRCTKYDPAQINEAVDYIMGNVTPVQYDERNARRMMNQIEGVVPTDEKSGRANRVQKKKKSGCLNTVLVAFIVFCVIFIIGKNSGKNNGALKGTSDRPSSTQSDMTVPEDSSLTTGQKNALKSAQNYLDYSAFSYSGLIHQLEFEGYSTEDATYAVDNCGADWSEQAVAKAQSYLGYSAFSRSGLIDQLEFEGFTETEATYGTDRSGADWNEQAAKKAQSYLDYSSFSREGLINQLTFEGFTAQEATYGAGAVGY